MNIFEIAELLKSIAESEREAILKGMPTDPNVAFVLFTETLRVSDMAILRPAISESNVKTVPYIDIVRMGWNLAVSNLLKPLATQAIPYFQSTKESREHASLLMYQLGCTVFLKRIADMVTSGLVLVEKTASGFLFKKAEGTDDQFLDELEFTNLDKLEKSIENGSIYGAWNIIKPEKLSEALSQPGSFIVAGEQNQALKIKPPGLESLMISLIRPWHFASSTLIGYETAPEIDRYFLFQAKELVLSWRQEAGLHPNAKIGNISGAELTTIVVILVSFHLKHVQFVMLAERAYPEISIQQNLTIWTPLQSMIEDISEFAMMQLDVVREGFKVITLKADEVGFLESHTSVFSPLLIDVGNGFVLRPISSLGRNPFFSIIAIQEHRDQSFRHFLSEHRESWVRENLYALFAGTRYLVAAKSIKVKEGKRIITDIDAAILDSLTGELGLFQIKWQDFFSNDVKKLRSKAHNLTKELDEWAGKLSSWMQNRSLEDILTALNLDIVNPKSKISVYLFGISRSGARMRGYGFETSSENLAISNWPQFVRNRYQIGPAEKVISLIFNALKVQERDVVPAISPLPVTLNLAGKAFIFEDLWCTMEE